MKSFDWEMLAQLLGPFLLKRLRLQVGCFILRRPDPEQRARQDRPAMPAAMRARAYVDLHRVCGQQPYTSTARRFAQGRQDSSGARTASVLEGHPHLLVRQHPVLRHSAHVSRTGVQLFGQRKCSLRSAPLLLSASAVPSWPQIWRINS